MDENLHSTKSSPDEMLALYGLKFDGRIFFVNRECPIEQIPRSSFLDTLYRLCNLSSKSFITLESYDKVNF